MKNPEVVISKDLQKFIDKFEPNKFKLMPRGIQIRGISHLPSSISLATKLIEKLDLNLIVTHHADMLGYRGFEVNNK